MPPTQKSVGPIIAAVVFGLLFLFAAGFGYWAFTERQSYKNDVDSKIDKAVTLAVQEAESAKEVEFLEREKLPTKTYTGSATYGTVSFDYPKTWSVYDDTSSRSGSVVNIYAHPNIVPGLQSNQPYALRLEILSQSYDSVLSQLQSNIDRGTLQASAFRPQKVSSVLGAQIRGAFQRDVNAVAVYLPLRDRTIRLSSEVPQNFADFENIILPSLTFIP